MKKLTAVILAGAVACSVMAQKTSPRMTAMWVAAHNRMEDMNDQWFKIGDYPRIVESLRYMNRMWQDDYETATNLGWMLGNVERYDEELATYVTYRSENPQDRDRSLPEADFYFRYHVWSKIPPLLEPDVARNPHPNVFRLLAHAYERLNLLQDSRRVWNRYIALMPTDGAAKRNLERVEKKIRGEVPMKQNTPEPAAKRAGRV